VLRCQVPGTDRASLCRADWQRDPGEADVGTSPAIGGALPSRLVTPAHSADAAHLRSPGGATFLAQVPGRCQEAGTGAVFAGTGQQV